MYQSIVAPLDGSALAESAMALVALVAERQASRVTFLTVLPQPPDDWTKRKPPPDGERSAEARARKYLESAAAQFTGTDEKPEVAVTFGDPASEIVKFARASGADLIAMATRGRSGVVRGLLGSVTDHVIHTTPVPVLVVRAERGDGPAQRIDSIGRIIVPLDGSMLAETSLPHAEGLAKSLEAEIVLVRSLQFPTMYNGDLFAEGYDEAALDAPEVQEDTEAYLAAMAKRLSESGLQVHTRVTMGHPVDQIAAVAQEKANSMVAMTTRGASGLSRWVVGSTADGVIRVAGVPTLVVPPVLATT